jgi:hypothetical protein
MRSMRCCLTAAVLLLVCVAPSLARRIDAWPYERLLKESDVVLIATAEGTTETKDRLKNTGWQVEFIGQDTTLVVRAALKGNLKGRKKVRVLHYRLPDDVLLQDGPLLVSFRSRPLPLKGTVNGKPINSKLPRPDYLIFLRARPDAVTTPSPGRSIPPFLSENSVRRKVQEKGKAYENPHRFFLRPGGVARGGWFKPRRRAAHRHPAPRRSGELEVRRGHPLLGARRQVERPGGL